MWARLCRYGVGVALLATCGCEENNPVAREQAAPASPPSVPPPEKPVPPWFVGQWSGRTEVKVLARPLDRDRADRDLKALESSSASDETVEVPLFVELQLTDAKVVSGTAMLGKDKLVARGVLDDLVLRVQLMGPEAQGTLVMRRVLPEGGASSFEGTARLSTTRTDGTKIHHGVLEGALRLGGSP